MSMVPRRRFYGQNYNIMIHSLHLYHQKAQQDGPIPVAGERLVMIYRIPSWQRTPVWSDEQAAHFIQSVYLGANIGSLMINSSESEAYDRILLDGQQRLTAIARYWNNEFSVHGDLDPNGEPLTPVFWGDLSSDDQAHFLRMPFPCIETAYQDEALMREAYNRHNFGGTPHRLDEKAADTWGFLAVQPTFRRG